MHLIYIYLSRRLFDAETLTCRRIIPQSDNIISLRYIHSHPTFCRKIDIGIGIDTYDLQRFNSKYMITRTRTTATIWDFPMVCNPQIKEEKNLQIGMLKNFPSFGPDCGFEFDDVQIVGVGDEGFIVFDFLKQQPQAKGSNSITESEFNSYVEGHAITRHFE